MPARWPQDASGADPNLSDEQKEEFCRWLTRSRVDLDEGDFISGREWAEYFGITRNEYHMIESRFMKDLKHSEITHDYKAELNDKANLFASPTINVIFIWQHRADLVSHEMTTQALLAEQTGADKRPEDLMMTHEDLEAVFDLDGEESLKSRFETGMRHRQKIKPDDDVKYALIGIPYEGECTDDVKFPPGVKADGGKLVYEIEDDRDLFNHEWDVLSEISDVNSEDRDEDDSEERWRLTVNSFVFCFGRWSMRLEGKLCNMKTRLHSRKVSELAPHCC
jgi:hypothetical protein